MRDALILFLNLYLYPSKNNRALLVLDDGFNISPAEQSITLVNAGGLGPCYIKLPRAQKPSKNVWDQQRADLMK